MKNPTTEFLNQYSETVLASTINMLFGTALELYMNEHALRPHMRCALMDSFRVHARSLLFFLYGSNLKSDDSGAQDFMKVGIEWSKIRENQSPALVALQRRVGKEVAHLTYSRPFDKSDLVDWDIGTEMRDLWLALNNFVRCADLAKLHESVRDSPERWRLEFQRCNVIKSNPNG